MIDDAILASTGQIWELADHSTLSWGSMMERFSRRLCVERTIITTAGLRKVEIVSQERAF